MKKELRTQAIFDEEHCKVWEDQMNEPSDKEFGESSKSINNCIQIKIQV